VACNVATQIVAQIASNQYGGQTFSLAHISKFVDVSRQKIRKAVIKEYLVDGIDATEEMISRRVEARLDDEIKQGIQTIQRNDDGLDALPGAPLSAWGFLSALIPRWSHNQAESD
jgi:anaerobic ribonucleoside-triphosphate reductase